MITTDNFKRIEVNSQQELRDWLMNNHSQSDSVWLITYKKTNPTKYISTSQILDELLCFGWIDGIRRALDDDQTMQLISPRKVQHWTKTYKDRFAKLESQNLITEAGFKSRDNSISLGLWNYMDDVDALIKPDDLVACLAKYPSATTNFDNINPSSKRFALRYIKIAKTPTIRAKRIEEISILAAKNQKLKGS